MPPPRPETPLFRDKYQLYVDCIHYICTLKFLQSFLLKIAKLGEKHRKGSGVLAGKWEICYTDAEGKEVRHR